MTGLLQHACGFAPASTSLVLVANNEFFIVPGYNPFANGGSSYTQNRFQVGVRFPIADSFSVRPYYLLQSVNLPAGWETNEIVGISLAF